MDELLHGISVFAMYLIPAAVIMLTARKFLKIPDELFRKILHFILLGAYFPFLFAFQTWWISAGFAASLIVVLYPILLLAGKLPFFSAFVNERKKGEFKSSMILALLTDYCQTDSFDQLCRFNAAWAAFNTGKAA